MSIQKKSLISTLKTAKKANITKDEFTLDHGRSVAKAQPVLKLQTKSSLVAKSASKFKTAVKTAVKS